MNMKYILAQIELFPQDKHFRIKNLVFANLGEYIKNLKDARTLIELYPTEQNFRIKKQDFIDTCWADERIWYQ